MTIATEDCVATSVGNGVTDTFPYEFLIPQTVDDPQFIVYLVTIATGVEEELTLDSDYSISGLGDPDGGEVTYPISGTKLPATKRIVIERRVPYTQTVDIINQNAAYLSAIETSIDRIAMQVQQLTARVANAVYSVPGLTSSLKIVPAADQLIGWDDTGSFLENKPTVSQSTAAAAAYAALAEQWASEDEDVVVEGSEYSAKHYSIKASDSADAADTSAVSAAGSALTASNAESTLSPYLTDIETVSDNIASVVAAAADIPSLAAKLNKDGSGITAAEADTLRSGIGAVLRGHIFGLVTSNDAGDYTNDIAISSGECASEQAEPILMTYAGGTIALDAAYGTGSGGRFDTSIADGTWHVFVISNGTTVGVGFSQSLDPTGEANYPSGYTHFRRIFSVLRESGALVRYTQYGDHALLKTPTTDVSSNNPGTSGVTATLRVPTGFVTEANFNASVNDSASRVVAYFSSLAVDDQSVASLAVAPIGDVRSIAGGVTTPINARVFTNTSRQIRFRLDTSTANTDVKIATLGWRDTRGRT